MKKGLIVGIICFGMISLAQAQQDTSIKLKPLKSFISGTSIVKKALYKAFRVIQQDYYLTDGEGGSFGRGNQPYFGRHYGIGVVAKNVLWSEKQVLYPWIVDKSYKVLAGDSLKPTQGVTKLANFNYAYSDCNCKYTELKKAKFGTIPQHMLAYYKLPAKTPSVSFHQGEIPEKGIMVIFYTKGDAPMSENTQVKMSITKQYIKWNDARSKGEVKWFKLPGKIVGGALFSESFDLGTVSYKLVAMYNRVEGKPKKWELTAFQNKFTSKLTMIKPKEEGKNKKKRKKRRRRRRN